MNFEELVRFLLSTVLGYGIVVGAIALKLPQIIKILRGKSAEGVSLTANVIEALGYTISAGWGISQQLTFKDYGETVFVLVQLFALILLIGGFQSNIPAALVSLAAVATSFYALSSGVVDRTIHEALLGSQVVLQISSRVPQIYMCYRNRSTGQLAFLTFFMAFAGCAARLITTTLNVPLEKGKIALLTQFGVGLVLNATILSQMWLYRKQGLKGNTAKKSTSPKISKKDA